MAAQVNPPACAAPSCLITEYFPNILATTNELLARKKPEEIGDGLWMIGVFERWGSMTQAEADEWRRRFLARQQFLTLPDYPADSSVLDR